MKKIAALLLALVMCLTLVACGGPDKQPAVDAYNKLAQTYNTFVDQENENLDSWTEEDIAYMNQIADVIIQYGEKLESDAELAQEEIDEMVEMFNEFSATIEEFLNG